MHACSYPAQNSSLLRQRTNSAEFGTQVHVALIPTGVPQWTCYHVALSVPPPPSRRAPSHVHMRPAYLSTIAGEHSCCNDIGSQEGRCCDEPQWGGLPMCVCANEGQDAASVRSREGGDQHFHCAAFSWKVLVCFGACLAVAHPPCALLPSGTESAILNRESCDSICDSDWRFLIDLFYSVGLRPTCVLFLQKLFRLQACSSWIVQFAIRVSVPVSSSFAETQRDPPPPLGLPPLLYNAPAKRPQPPQYKLTPTKKVLATSNKHYRP